MITTKIDETEFYILRYSLTEEKQKSCFPKALPFPKGNAIEVAILNDQEWLDKGTIFSFVGFKKVHFNNLDTKNIAEYLYIGKFARLRKAKLGGKIPGDIIDHEEDDWIPVIVIFDTKNQFIFVQKSYKFSNGDNIRYICRKIEKGLLNSVLPEYNYNIFVEPVPKQGGFWSIVDTHEKIYELDMTLISPNILQTNQKARKALENIQDLYSPDKTEIKMKSKSGSLEVPKNPIGDYIEYIEEGEGEWKVKVDEKGRKKTISSYHMAETIVLPIYKEEDELIFRDQYELDVVNDRESDINNLNSFARRLVKRVYSYINDRRNE